jgi:hypothetical protein
VDVLASLLAHGPSAELEEPGKPPVCMGNVYAETRPLPVWAESLPMLPMAGGHSGK